MPCRRLIQRRLFAGRKLCSQPGSDGAREFILQGKQIFNWRFVRSGHSVIAITAIKESEHNARNVVRPPDGAFQQMSYSELASDAKNIALLSRQIRTSTSPSDYSQVGKSSEAVSDLILHSHREIGVLAIWAEIFERQHRN